VKKYTFSEWMEEFRPDGIGRIQVSTLGIGPGGVRTENKQPEIQFTEVICDLCNDLIEPRNEKGEEPVIFVESSYSMCEKCASTFDKGGK